MNCSLPCAARLVAVAAALISTLAHPARAQEMTRVDLRGIFLHGGGVAGTVTAAAGPVDANDTGYGWSAGGGLGLWPWLAVVGGYSTFRVQERRIPSYDVDQLEVGARLRIGGVHTTGIFYVEGGGAGRRMPFATTTLFPDDPPPGAADTVRVMGLSGWFGPGVQVYFGRRVAVELAVAWAWGDFTHARIGGDWRHVADPPAMTTLRLRAGLVAALF